MGRTGSAVLGLLGGAAAGFLLAVLVVILCYDVLGIASNGGDGLSGLSTFMVLAPLLMLAGGVAGAIRLGRRAPGEGGKGYGIAAAAALALMLLALLATGRLFW